MLIRTRDDQSRLHRRQCVACGYSGRFVDRAAQESCPRCQCDFTVRPPMSYAEMEGFEASDLEAARARRLRTLDTPAATEWRLVDRWLAFLFAVAVVGIAVIATGVALLVPH
ncbi:MAG: hypothetical protein ACO3QC_08485 [Phycisphaerales bacterium]